MTGDRDCAIVGISDLHFQANIPGEQFRKELFDCEFRTFYFVLKSFWVAIPSAENIVLKIVQSPLDEETIFLIMHNDGSKILDKLTNRKVKIRIW